MHLEERVAIKFLQPETLKDANVVARFLREGRAAARIRSEHVARVYDVGSLENGAPYLVMEYLDGSDLAALVRTHGPLPVPVAAEYLLQACEAIAEAHAMGIVHRDLKPSNLFITTRPDGSPAIKVIDFGISKVTPRTGEVLEMTKTAEARGSPLFMSPEQMTSPRSVDARTDIWALGVTLYHLLTGGYPFYAATLPELCGLVLQSEPAPLRMRRPDLPPSLETLIARSLRKNPAERYANMAELAAALGEFASPLARLSVDRIFRVLGASAIQGHHPPASLPTAGWSAPASGELPAPPPRAPFPSTSTVASSGEAPPGATMQAQTGAVSWGATRSPGSKHTVLMVAALSVIGAIAGVAIVLVLRLDGHSTPDPPPGSALLNETASASPSPVPSAVIVAPAEVQPAPPPASAELPAPAPIAVAAPAASTAPVQAPAAPTAISPQRAPSSTPAPKKKNPAKTELF